MKRFFLLVIPFFGLIQNLYCDIPLFISEKNNHLLSAPSLHDSFWNFEIYKVNSEAYLQAMIDDFEINICTIQLKDIDWQYQYDKNHTINYNLSSRYNQQPLQFSTNRFFRGSVNNTISNADILLTVDPTYTGGMIVMEHSTYYIEPLYRFIPNAPSDLVIIYEAQDVKESNRKCLAIEVEKGNDKRQKTISDFYKQVGNCLVVEYAIAADYSMYDYYNSAQAVINYVTNITNLMSVNYDDEFADEITFEIVEIFVVDTPNGDPWISSTDATLLIDDFASWAPTGFSITHDLGTLYTNRTFDDFVVGIAFVGGLCTSGRYNCISDFSTNLQALRVTVAHEIGHNFNAEHDAANSSFIMTPAVNINANAWSTASQSTINAFIPTRYCLGNCPNPCPQFISVTPINCDPLAANYDLQVIMNTAGLTGSFNLVVNGQSYPQVWGNSPLTITLSNLPNNGQSGIEVSYNISSLGCSDSYIYDAPVADCVCSTLFALNEGFDNCALPGGWTTSINAVGYNNIGTCKDIQNTSNNTAFSNTPFSFSCTGEYPFGFSGAGSGPAVGFSDCIAVIDDDDLGTSSSNPGPIAKGCIHTPTMDLSDYSDLTLNFDFQNEPVGTLGVFTTEVWNGSTWQSIYTNSNSENGHIEMDISTHNYSTFVLRFCYDDEGAWAWGLAIDNVQICGHQSNLCGDGIMNGNETGIDCGGSCSACNTAGCMDPVACNYNSLATIDNGTCSYTCYGCMDISACNYNALATIPDLCDYDCYGCTDPEAHNYDIGATISDGSCETCYDEIQNGNEEGIDCGTVCNSQCGSILRLKLFLEGAYNPTTNTMNTSLVQNQSITNIPPYFDYPHYYLGNEYVQNFPSTVTDWLYIEIRDANNINTVVDQRACLLNNDGRLMDVDGTIGVSFSNLVVGNSYKVAIFHRSHLAVIATENFVPGYTNEIDITQLESAAYGVEQLKFKTNAYTLFSGDFDSNGVINNLDYNAWISNNAAVSAYTTWDADLNNIVNNIDYNYWYANRSKVGVPEIQP